MKRIVIVGVFLLLAHSSLVAENKEPAKPSAVTKIGDAAPADAPVKEIEVSAKKYEFAPNVIEVPAKTLVRIHLKALDKEHGFELKDFKDSCVRFKPREPSTVEVYADKTGEYEFLCCKFCGLGHGKMKGKLVVK
jgi:cytochrome c oxidase subunit II